VVGNVRETLVSDAADFIDAVIYTPYGPTAIRSNRSSGPPAEMSLVIKTTSDELQLAAAVKKVVADLQPDAPVSQFQTLKGWVAEALAGPRSTSLIFSAFSALALLLGAVGIYGVLSYSVAQRTREIGIRMALGARRSKVLLFVAGTAAKLAGFGIVAGIAGAMLLTRFMRTILYDVSTIDAETYVVVAVLLAFVALLACLIPAQRAIRVDPIVALREE
jgi:ABC-type antimicrobial peptide transport system permease subunit